MRCTLVLHQPAPESGAFEKNAKKIVESLRAARLRRPETPVVLFAPRAALEGLEGLRALECDFVRMARDAALKALHEEARLLKALVYMTVEGDRGPIAMVLGRNDGPTELRAFERRTGFEIDCLASTFPSVSVLTQDNPMLLWEPFEIREPFCSNVSESVGLQSGTARISPSLGGCETSHACAGGSFVDFGGTRFTARCYEPDALAFDCAAEDGRLLEVGAPERLLETPARSLSLPQDERLAALIAAIRDYVSAVRAEGVVLGISGGIDSALVAAAAVEALGAARVRAQLLASRFTSQESRELARTLAERLGLELAERSIEVMHEAARRDYADDLGDMVDGEITDQNIQARLRSLRLMAIANKENRILLCTANKSEAAMGYGTLYGDLSGGFSPIVDLWKSEVRALCRAFNAWKGSECIPEAIIEREPTAELRFDQKDSDSLPPYDEIERVMRAALGTDFEPADFTEAELSIVRAAARFAFKRRQCSIGLRLSSQTLGDFDERFGINRTIDMRR